MLPNCRCLGIAFHGISRTERIRAQYWAFDAVGVGSAASRGCIRVSETNAVHDKCHCSITSAVVAEIDGCGGVLALVVVLGKLDGGVIERQQCVCGGSLPARRHTSPTHTHTHAPLDMHPLQAPLDIHPRHSPSASTLFMMVLVLYFMIFATVVVVLLLLLLLVVVVVLLLFLTPG